MNKISCRYGRWDRKILSYTVLKRMNNVNVVKQQYICFLSEYSEYIWELTSTINNIGNSFPAKLLRSAIKFRNACRKINFSYCKVHSVLKLNLACLMYFTCQYLLKLSSSSAMICFIHTWFTEHMSSTCRTINSK